MTCSVHGMLYLKLIQIYPYFYICLKHFSFSLKNIFRSRLLHICKNVSASGKGLIRHLELMSFSIVCNIFRFISVHAEALPLISVFNLKRKNSKIDYILYTLVILDKDLVCIHVLVFDTYIGKSKTQLLFLLDHRFFVVTKLKPYITIITW